MSNEAVVSPPAFATMKKLGMPIEHLQEVIAGADSTSRQVKDSPIQLLRHDGESEGDVFYSVKWENNATTLVGGLILPNRDMHIALAVVLPNTKLPYGRVRKGMAAIAVMECFFKSFSRHGDEQFAEILARYEDWYFRRNDVGKLLQLPVLKAIKVRHLEGLSERVQGQGYADILEDKCEQFRQLVGTANKEELLHQWLSREENMIFFGADVEWVQSKLKIAHYETDFVVKRTSKPYLLVEIERSNLRVFNRGNEERTAEFNHACQQVKDWQTAIGKDVRYFRDYLDIPDLDRPHGLVVLGRSEDINTKTMKDRWETIKVEANPDAMTFDEMIQRVRTCAKLLRRQV